MDELTRIPSRLAEIWKDYFSLYTHYIGYLTPGMAKTIMQFKRDIDNSSVQRQAAITLEEINEYARRHGTCDFPYAKEMDDAILRLWDYLEDFDFSELSISADKWMLLMNYIDYCDKRKGCP